MREGWRAALLSAVVGVIGASPAQPCELALMLTIDVSGSIDRAEYRWQVDGLADALDDPEIIDALMFGQVALAVVQWSGAGMQELTLPWRRMLSLDEVRDFGRRARAMDRAYVGSDTAVGEAISFSLEQFAQVPDCHRRVIDISGDGAQNAGLPLAPARTGAGAMGVQINAIAIEDVGRSIPISEFYRRFVITRNGFVLTARGVLDYPRAIRAKILRELAKPLG
jgi:Ca-activated chloride channel family protein